MSFGFDPLTATLVHPSNPEPAIKHAIENMLTSTIKGLLTDLADPQFLAQRELTQRHAADRIRWLNEELTRRQNKAAAAEAHRVRAEETNIFADMAEEEADLRAGKVDDV